MSNLPEIIILDLNTVVRSRIKQIMLEYEVVVSEAFNPNEIMKLIAANEENIKLVITDIDIDPNGEFDGISIIKLLKTKAPQIPVLVLSSTSKKEIITKCIVEGAADYILKPFEHKLIRDKILKFVGRNIVDEVYEDINVKFSLGKYLLHEMYKARKGNYAFSLFRVIFHLDVKEEEFSDLKTFKYLDLIFEEMKSLFWETDVYVHYNRWSHFGFFPFCTTESIPFIKHKVDAKFAQIISANPEIANLVMKYDFTTYPVDGSTIEELLKELSNRLNVQ